MNSSTKNECFIDRLAAEYIKTGLPGEIIGYWASGYVNIREPFGITSRRRFELEKGNIIFHLVD